MVDRDRKAGSTSKGWTTRCTIYVDGGGLLGRVLEAPFRVA